MSLTAVRQIHTKQHASMINRMKKPVATLKQVLTICRVALARSESNRLETILSKMHTKFHDNMINRWEKPLLIV